MSRYRLYPEVLFPVPYLDCLAAAKHFLSPAVLAKYLIDPDRVAVAGDSAGGNLAAAVAQTVRAKTISSSAKSSAATIFMFLCFPRFLWMRAWL